MRSCSLRELERLIGFLYWLSLAFFELLPSLGRFLELKRAGHAKMGASGRSRNKVKLSLSVQAQSDMMLCQRLLLEWEGTRDLWDWEVAKVTCNILGDASEWGFGAYCIEAKQYYYRAWTEAEKAECFRGARHSLMQMEARVAVVSICTWRSFAKRKKVALFTDNEWAKDHLTAGYCKQKDCQKTIRAFWFEKLRTNCVTDVIHLSGDLNYAADHLSRNREQEFLALPGFEGFSRIQESIPRSW